MFRESRGCFARGVSKACAREPGVHSENLFVSLSCSQKRCSFTLFGSLVASGSTSPHLTLPLLVFLLLLFLLFFWKLKAFRVSWGCPKDSVVSPNTPPKCFFSAMVWFSEVVGWGRSIGEESSMARRECHKAKRECEKYIESERKKEKTCVVRFIKR